MRKQEWADYLLKKITINICLRDTWEDLVRRAIEETLNHPEFEPEKPVYTYELRNVVDEYGKWSWFVVFANNSYHDESCRYQDRSLVVRVADATIRALNEQI